MANNNPFMNGSVQAVPVPGAPTSSFADNFEVDLTGVQENNYTIPDGNYKIKCKDVEQGVSKAGNPQFIWTFEVSDGKYAGFELKSFTAITPAAMWKVAETVQALGIGQTGSMVKFKRTDVIGMECGALVEASEYNGNTRSSIVRVMSLKELAESRA